MTTIYNLPGLHVDTQLQWHILSYPVQTPNSMEGEGGEMQWDQRGWCPGNDHNTNQEQ
jgi:hypothetical protein